jgi:hypothetical protein
MRDKSADAKGPSLTVRCVKDIYEFQQKNTAPDEQTYR